MERRVVQGRTDEICLRLGYENGRVFALGNARNKSNLITVAMVFNDGLYERDACQQALGVRDNVDVKTLTSQALHVSAGPDQPS